MKTNARKSKKSAVKARVYNNSTAAAKIEKKASKIQEVAADMGFIHVSKARIIDDLTELESKPKAVKSPAKSTKSEGKPIRMIKYSEKAVAVFGETKPIKDLLKELNGRFNGFLESGGKDSGTEKIPGWIFSMKHEANVRKALKL